MDVTQWYAVGLGAIVVSPIVFLILWSIRRIDHTYLAFLFLKHVFYPQIHRYLRGSGKTTLFDVILILGFLITNVLCITIGVQDTSTLMKRTALMSTINLIPLSLGHHINFIFDRCGIKSKDYGRIHRWLGRAAVVEGFMHSVVAATSHAFNMHATSQVAAWVVSSGELLVQDQG